jgi:uncharacterized membrane protein
VQIRVLFLSFQINFFKKRMKTKKILLSQRLFFFFCVLSLIFFWGLMYNIVFPYTSGKTDIDFLLSKQKIIHLKHYRWSFYLHIFSSLLILAAGLTQFSSNILQRVPIIHRWIGKIYTFGILIISAPAALVMSFYANGGWIAKPSFILLSLLWWYTTWQGYQAIRRKAIQEHRIWMLRSYALTFSAITLRLMQAGFAAYTDLDLDTTYQIVSWASWMINLLIAEYVLKQRFAHLF